MCKRYQLLHQEALRLLPLWDATISHYKGLMTCLSVPARDDPTMTKAESRAAARAYRQQKLREMAQEIHKDRVNADLAELDSKRVGDPT